MVDINYFTNVTKNVIHKFRMLRLVIYVEIKQKILVKQHNEIT